MPKSKSGSKKSKSANAAPEFALAAAAAPAPPDPFVDITAATIDGLDNAVREFGWIADGGDPTSSQSDRDLANVKRAEFDNARTRVMQRLIAYLGKQLGIVPPSPADVVQAKELATHLGQMIAVNVKVVAVIDAATRLMDIYRKTEGAD